jgi:hypothetical protein
VGGRFYDTDSSSRDGVVASYYGHRNAATVGMVVYEEEACYKGARKQLLAPPATEMVMYGVFY